jgi:capsular exopolysaccharide synthesis family protein
MEPTALFSPTLRDYMRVYFRQKVPFVVTFFLILGAMYFLASLKTPVYEAQVTLLITGERKIEAQYYKAAENSYSSGASTIALTQSELVLSNPVIERAVSVLKLYQRSPNYERYFAMPLKVKWLEMLDTVKARWQHWRGTGPSSHAAADAKAVAFRRAVMELKENINVDPEKNTNLLQLTVRDFDPEAAADIANVVSRSYIIFDLEQQLAEYRIVYGETHQIVEQLSADVNRMIYRIRQDPKTNIEAIGPASVKIIAPARVPFEPISLLGKRSALLIFLGIFLAALAGAGVSLIFEYLDSSFRSPQDVEKNINLPYLGYIPRPKWYRSATLRKGSQSGAYGQAHRTLMDSIYLLLKGKRIRTLALLSAMNGEGTTLLTANLGVFLAKKFRKQTLVIDGNLRHPSLHHLFKLSRGPGLAEVLEGKIPLKNVLHTLEPGLTVLTAGKCVEEPVALLSSMKMAAVLKEIKEQFEVVLLDCPPLNQYQDGEVLSLHSEGSVFVVSEGRTRRQIVKNIIRKWEEVRSNMLGVILCNRRFHIPGIFYRFI